MKSSDHMQKVNRFVYIAIVPVVIVFVVGMVRIFALRFEKGDVYPPYSSLRADPLGVKALYESLNSLHAIAARRNYQPLARIREKEDKTFFYLGADVRNDFLYTDKASAKALEEIADKGGRLVISFYPVYKGLATETQCTEKSCKADNHNDCATPDKEKETQQEENGCREKPVSLGDAWGVKPGYAELPGNKNNASESTVAFREGALDLPDSLSLHTWLYFDALDESWRVIYTREGHPVIIEKPCGRGTIVLSADSYFLSNEAMRQERHPRLLAWLAGPHREIVFDETHFGVVKQPGIAALLRKYRLYRLIAALVLLAGLFVWKNSLSFIPPRDDTLGEEQGHATGKDFTVGLINLLRRNIPPREIVSVCFKEWKKSLAHGRKKDLRHKLSAMQAVIDAENAGTARERNPVKCYQTLSTMLNRRTE